jgi:hypothetical protein
MGFLGLNRKSTAINFPNGVVLDSSRDDYQEVASFLSRQLSPIDPLELSKLLSADGPESLLDAGIVNAWSNVDRILCWGKINLEPPTFSDATISASISIGAAGFSVYWSRFMRNTNYINVQFEDLVGAQWESPFEIELALGTAQYAIESNVGNLPECRLKLTMPKSSDPFENRRSFSVFATLRMISSSRLSN